MLTVSLSLHPDSGASSLAVPDRTSVAYNDRLVTAFGTLFAIFPIFRVITLEICSR